MSALLQPRELPPDATPEQRFTDAVARGWPVYAHPETATMARAAGVAVLGSPMMKRGELVAVKPSDPLPPIYLAPLSLSFRPR